MHWKYPEWLILVLSMDEQEQVNVMLAGWAMSCSSEPPMFAVAISQQNRTHEVISRTGEFVVAFPSKGMESDALYCGTHSGRDGDKLQQTAFETISGGVVRPPLLKGCRINLECQLVDALPTGDHSIFAGQVMAAHLDMDAPPNIVNFGQMRFAVAHPV